MKIIFNKNKDYFTQKEFKQLFENNYESLRDYIYYKSGNIEQAEDIAQEAFLKLWEKRKELKQETILSYLFRIAHNIFLNQVKREQVVFNFQNQSTDDYIERSSPEFELELKEFDQILQKALASIPEKHRVVFLLNRIDGLKYKEIAERLDLTTKAVEKRMQKAMEILKTAVKGNFKI